MVAPKLRFKEFDGDWKQETLKNLATFSKGKGISKADISEDGINLCIRYGELYTTYGQVIDHIYSRTNVSKSECILSKAGDVIIPASGETQIDIATASCVLHDDIILSGDLNILSHEENGSWLAYYLSSAKKLEIAQLAQGNSVVHLYSSQLKDLKINKPSKEEQTKIASFLSAVDEKISQLTQKHELLSQYKQGMMQKLFSQQIRFKADDGSEFGEWETKLIKEIADVKGGKRLPKGHSLINENTGHPYITVSDMNRSYSIDSTNIRYVPLEVVDIIKRYTITDKDIFISVAGTLGIIGKIPTEFNGANLTENADKLTNLKCHQDFLIYLLDSGYLSELIESTATTSAQPKLALYAIEQLEIQIPCLEEQTKIANFLSSIDQKIEVVAQQIEQAKQWKKGLLQQMFV
nr:restriction endonuclease subunit S [Acinetobacter indicus]